MATYSRIEWALEAVKGIILPRERESAMQELLDHMEDHMEALVAAGFSRFEAEQQAVSAMGAPEDTAKLLRLAHQPILTRILQAARVCCISLAVLAALALFVSFVKKDDLLPDWFQGTPYPELQASSFSQPTDDSILFRRVCAPDASLTVGDYTLRVDKAAVNQYADRWEVRLLVEMKGDYLWQDPPVLPPDCRFLVGEDVFDFDHTAFWGHRQGGSYYSWFDLELVEEAEMITLELPCEDRTYALDIHLKGGEVYEKAH